MDDLLDDINPIFIKNKKDIRQYTSNIVKVDNPINEKLGSYLISNNYVEIINENFKNKQEINYNNSRNTVIINLYTTKNKKYDVWSINDYDILDLNIVMVLSVMDYLKLKNNKIVVYFYPTNLKKEWNGRNLTPEVINSGYTNHDIDKYILIYRKEEYNRLLLHELIHYLSLDNAINNKVWSPTHMQISLDYNIFNHINLFETYTDTWAILLIIIMTKIINPKISINSLLEKEKGHMLCQLSIPDIDSIKIHTWVQNTSALSYYVFKYGTLNMSNFIRKYKLGIKLDNKRVEELYKDIRKELNGKFIEMRDCSKSAKLSYLGYDV